MSYAARITANEIWMQQIFASDAARTGGVVRRNVRDVDRKVGRRALELEVRKRGYHLIECGGQYVIVCGRAELRVIV